MHRDYSFNIASRRREYLIPHALVIDAPDTPKTTEIFLFLSKNHTKTIMLIKHSVSHVVNVVDKIGIF